MDEFPKSLDQLIKLQQFQWTYDSVPFHQKITAGRATILKILVSEYATIRQAGENVQY